MTFQFLHLKNFPIIEQLKIEETLVRSETENWCIINQGSPVSIVMGISGKKEELVDLTLADRDGIPVIKRFSGGGTVIVDENTLFVTFICNKELHPFPAFPEPIMRWTEEIYKDAFAHGQFNLRENDFVIGEKKIGGNAQYIKKNRWLHHTSFLWDYSDERMNYLLHPKKTPKYRDGRTHSDFLGRLSDHFSDLEKTVTGIRAALERRYVVIPTSLEEVKDRQMGPGRAAIT